MPLRIYNTMTRRKDEFVPITPGKIGIYVCGVTVYDDAHLGHARSVVAFDAIVRYLRYKGFEVNHVTNFTDVDDKIIDRAKTIGVKALDLSKTYIEEFFEDMDALRVKRATNYPKASETIPEIIAMVKELVDTGHAYEVCGDVNFDILTAKDYGKLSGQSLDQIESGARVEVDEKKRNPADFALWKAAKEGEISWKSPWGQGRPGWHIECSAMSLKYIGETIDIHGGGSDLIFPHHENEIQQSEMANGAQFVRYWMHNGMLTINEEKMSKSLKNFFRVKDVLKKYDASTVRFFLLNTHYRQPLNYDESSLDDAKKSLERLQNTFYELKAGQFQGKDDATGMVSKAKDDFVQKMDDDFNTRDALAVIFGLARDANRLMSEKKLSQKGAESIITLMGDFDSVFDILKKEEAGTEELASKLMKLILRIRDDARKRKDFATSDTIRDGLKELNIEIQDSADGPKWKIKK